MLRRVQVEVEWFIALGDAGFAEFKPLSAASRSLLRSRVQAFSEADAQAIKDIEKTTNHDVKAVEYWLKSPSCTAVTLKPSGARYSLSMRHSSRSSSTSSTVMLDDPF